MEETFFININCSEILVDNDETQYTMFIDSTKMSIVFELIEWIRWMFSVENCVYLTHENSVIHELEDIQVLSKLKNFEIKPCGRFQCVHTKTYRTLLNNFSVFVSWNETKVPKYFLYKINQMSHKLTLETNNHLKVTKSKGFIENETGENNINKTDSPESSYLNKPLKKSNMEKIAQTNKRAFFDDLDINKNTTSSKEISKHFNKLSQSKRKCTSTFEDNEYSKNGIDPLNKTGNSNSVSLASVNNAIKNESDISKNFAKSKTGKKFTKLRPFSIGEILSDIRENLVKENVKTTTYKNNSSCEEENFDLPVTSLSEDLSVKDDDTGSGLKRKRIRRRKRSKNKTFEEIEFMPPLSKTVSTFKSPNSTLNFKPNHIRFDINEENNFSETALTNDIAKLPNTYLFDQKMQLEKIEPGNLNAVTNNNFKGSESLVNNFLGGNDNKMEFLEVHNQNNNENLIDLAAPDYANSSQRENCQESSSAQDLSMLVSLKDKFRNAVVLERFY